MGTFRLNNLQLTERSTRVIDCARKEAVQLGGTRVSTAHLLLGFCKEYSSIAGHVLKDRGILFHRVRAEIQKQCTFAPENKESQSDNNACPPLSRKVKSIIEQAEKIAQNFGDNYIGTEHILLSILNNQNSAGYLIILELGITPTTLVMDTYHMLGKKLDGTNENATESQKTPTAEDKLLRQISIRIEDCQNILDREAKKSRPNAQLLLEYSGKLSMLRSILVDSGLDPI